MEKIKNRQSRIEAITRALEKFFGRPGPKASHGNTLESLILTILSQNTTDKNSRRAFDNLKRQFENDDGGIDWKRVATAPVADVADAIRSGGLANQKSERIRDLLRWINEKYGKFNLDFICEMQPEDAIREFTARKGIGLKTIAVVLAFSCGKDIFPVDTHVHRVCRRVGLVGEKDSADQTYAKMKNLVPEGKAYSLHINMVRLGREICRPRNPDCTRCPLKSLCDYGLKGSSI